MEEQNTPVVTTSQNENPKVGFAAPLPLKQKKGRPLFTILLIVGIVLLAGGIFYYLSSKGTQESKESPSPSPSVDTENTTQTTIPTSTSTAKLINKAEVSIQILNGTGISGEAAYLKDKLVSLGYEKVSTGNSDKTTNTTTIVCYNTSLSKSASSEITKELEGIYKDVDEDDCSTGNYEVKITTGLKKGQTSKPQSTQTPVTTTRPTVSSTSSPVSSSTPTATSTSTP